MNEESDYLKNILLPDTKYESYDPVQTQLLYLSVSQPTSFEKAKKENKTQRSKIEKPKKS